MCKPFHGGGASAVDMAAMNWRKAYFAAHMELMTEKLKKKMDAAWGPMVDKAADAVVESMGKQWMAMVQESGAEQELREKLARLFSEGQKR